MNRDDTGFDVDAAWREAVALRDAGAADAAFAIATRLCAARDDRALDQFRVALGLYRDGADEAFLSDLRGWYYARERARRPFAPLRPRRGPPRARPRVGFMGWDLVIPCYAALLLPLLRRFDPARVEVVAVVVDAPEPMLDRLRALGVAAVGVPVGKPWDDAGQARGAAAVAALELDLLVDLQDCLGPTPSVPLHRPAPVQATWQNMLGPCPDPVYDALIGNAALYPPGAADYDGKAALLPADLFAYEPDHFPERPPSPSPSPCLANGYVTFGSLSQLYKMGETSLALWAKVQRAVPGSRLRLGNGGLADPGARQRVLATLVRHGADPARIEFGAVAGWPAYLDAYSGIDVALATVPVAGGTTMFEAAWQGVPVLSRVYPSPLGRIGRWLEAAADLPGTAHDDDASYVAAAASLAANPAALAATRAGARERLAARNARDAPRLTRAFETLAAELVARGPA